MGGFFIFKINLTILRKPTFYFFCLFLFCGCYQLSNENYNGNSEARSNLRKKISSKDIESVYKIKILDSVLKVLSEDSKDTLVLWSIMKKSNLLYNQGETDSILYYDKLLFRESLILEQTKYAAISSNNIGLNFNEIQKFDSAYYYFNLSKNFYLELADSLKVGNRLLSMAQIQKDYNDLYGAKETVTEAFGYLSNSSNTKQLSRANDLLGTLNRKLQNYLDALAFHEKAINISTNPLSKTGYKNNLALVYVDLGEYSKAIQVYKSILNDSILNKDSSRYARILHNLAYSRWKNGGTKVEKELLHALKLREQSKDLRGLVASYTDLAEFYVKSNPKRAKTYLDSLILVSKEVKMPQGEIDALKLLMVLRPNTIQYRDRYIILKDSLYQQELKVKTQFAKMKYDDQQEKARLLALETETAQKEAQLAQQEIQKILFLSLSAILLMGGVSLYFVLKQRHKKERLQEVYNTEKRIAQEIHDSLSNDVFSLMTKVQNEKTDTEEFLGNLEHIYKTSRQISHDNSEIQTGTAFESELKNLINTYHGRGITVVTKGMNDIDWSLLSEHKCIALHRTINEILVNMRKHSQASLVSFTFEQDKGTLLITYTDNGVGIDPQKPKGIGLKNTVSRMNAIGSVFKFVPKSFGPGVKAEIAIPI